MYGEFPPKQLQDRDKGEGKMTICANCNGKGEVLVRLGLSSGRIVVAEALCDKCNGMGEVNKPGVCQKCNGRKSIFEPLETSAKMPVKIETDSPDCIPTTIVK